MAYGVGHYGKSLMWHGSELLFAFYLTDVCGLAPGPMAIVLGTALFASGLLDISVGHAMRARIRSVHAAATMQTLGAIASGAAFVLFLTLAMTFPPVTSSQGPRLGTLALAAGLGFRLAYAFYDVPQNAVLGLIRVDDAGRAGLSSLRFVCSGLASLTIAGVAPLLLAKGRQAEWFAAFSGAVALASVASSLVFLRTARNANAAPRAEQAPNPKATNAHPPWRALLPMLWLGFAIAVAGVVFTKLEPYFVARFLTPNPARATVMLVIACGGIAGQPLVLRIAARAGPVLAFRVSASALAAGALAFAALGGRDAWYAAGAGCIVAFGLNGLGMLVWTAIGNLTASSAALSPTLTFGLLTFGQKSASALGTIVIGAVLHLQAAPAEAASPMAIVLAMGLVPLAGAVICAVLAPRLLAVPPQRRSRPSRQRA
jgi:Na+/melibiose symporter-like transporter